MAKQGLMGIRPNKTNFGLSFGNFWEQKREEERRREEEEKKMKNKKRKGMDHYGFMTLSMETRDLYGDV